MIESPSHNNELATSLRTDACGLLRRDDVGRTVRLGGWVHKDKSGGAKRQRATERTTLTNCSGKAVAPNWATPNCRSWHQTQSDDRAIARNGTATRAGVSEVIKGKVVRDRFERSS